MVSLAKWTPSESVKQWLRQVVEVLRDGGTWVAPATGMAVTVWPSKLVWRVSVKGDDPVMVVRTRAVFAAIGWREDSGTTQIG